MDTVNLPPGSVVPKSGNYKCEFCGAGGLADFAAKSMLGFDLSRLRGGGRQGAIKFFDAGKTFTECANCGPATGWSLIEGA